MSHLILIHEFVEEPELLRVAFKDAVSIIVKENTSIYDILTKINISKLTHIALIFHPVVDAYIPFFENSGWSRYKYISNGLMEIIQFCGVPVDLLACSLNKTDFIEQIGKIRQHLGIEIRFSLNDTGNTMDWILESDSIDVKDLYFNSAIDRWNYTLFPIYRSSRDFVLDKDLNFIFLKTDICGNSLDVRYDAQMRNIQRNESAIISWGNPRMGGDSLGEPDVSGGVVAVQPSAYNFVALKTGGMIKTWGSPTYKYDMERVGVNGVVALYSNRFAHCALKTDGSVVSWGSVIQGGLLKEQINNVIAVFSTEYAFAALKTDGSVVVWGNPEFGGYLGTTLTGVVTISATNRAFAALKADGSVVAWGYPSWGGSMGKTVNGVKAIFSNGLAFAALKTDGTVECWGAAGYGGVLNRSLSNVVKIYSNVGAFAALKSDGAVECWGYAGWGGVAPVLVNVKTVYSTGFAFAALHTDGTVTSWGLKTEGGDSATKALVDVTAVYSNRHAFAARRAGGQIVLWGNPFYGATAGDSEIFLLANVNKVYSTERSFAALKNDGDVITWGNINLETNTGGDSSAVQAYLNNIIHIESTTEAFAAFRTDASGIVYTESSNNFISEVVDNTAQTLGDPHIYPLIGRSYELPNKVATYRLLQGRELIINGNTRHITEEERHHIRLYYAYIKRENPPIDLIDDGVFYQSIYVKSEGNIFYFNFDKKKAMSDKYFVVSQTEEDDYETVNVSFKHALYGDIVLNFYYFMNPQIKYGLGIKMAKVKNNLFGLLVREYKTNSMEIQGVSDEDDVWGEEGKNAVFSVYKEITV